MPGQRGEVGGVGNAVVFAVQQGTCLADERGVQAGLAVGMDRHGFEAHRRRPRKIEARL